MDKVINSITYNLNRWGGIQFAKLDEKTQRRLIQLEEFIYNNNEEIKKALERVKVLKISKSAIAKAESINFTRKTIYNDPILNEYIEHAIADAPDYFNHKVVNKLNADLKELQEQYYQVIDNIIDFNLLKIELEEYKKEIKNLKKENERIKTIIYEQEQTIQGLQRVKRQNNNVLYLD